MAEKSYSEALGDWNQERGRKDYLYKENRDGFEILIKNEVKRAERQRIRGIVEGMKIGKEALLAEFALRPKNAEVLMGYNKACKDILEALEAKR